MSPSTAWRLSLGFLLASLAVLICFTDLVAYIARPGRGRGLAWPSPVFMEEETRRDRLARVCRQYRGQTNMQIVYEKFLYDKKSNSLYCSVPKAGSTTYWSTYLKLALKLRPRMTMPTERRILKKTLFRFDKDNFEAVLARKPFVFAVTRHPHERLVSAYVDFKLEHYNSRKWRKVQISSDLIRQICCQGQKASCASSLAWREPASRCRKLSFQEFLTEVVLREAGDCQGVGCNGRMNVHWRPMDNHCSFCALNYSLLSSMDTFSRDHARVAGILGVKVQQKKKKKHTHIGANINEVTREMFSNVPEHVLESINRVYKFDLEMFGNTPYPGHSS